MKLKNNDLVGLAVTIGFSGFLAFAYGFGIYLFPVLGPDMRLDLDFSYTEMGFVAAGIQAGFIFSSAVTGAVAPRFGELRVIYLSMLFCGVCLLALSQVRTSAEAALVLVFVGFVPASTWIPMVAVVRRYIQFNRRGLVFGLLSGSGGYGAIINGQVVPILQHEIGWRGVWIVTGSTTIGMTLACILLFRFLGVTDKQKPSPEAAATLPAGNNETPVKLVSGNTLRLWAIMLLGAAITISYQTFFTAMLRDHLEATRELAGRMTLLHGLVGIVAAPSIGFAVDRIGIRSCFVIVTGCMLVSSFLLSIAGSTLIVAASAILFGFAFYPFFGLPPAYASKTMDANLAVRVFAVGNVFVGLGALLGNLSGGLVVMTFHGLPSVFVWLSVLALLLFSLVLTLPKPIELNRRMGEVEEQ